MINKRSIRLGLLVIVAIIIASFFIIRPLTINPLVVPIDKEKHTLNNYIGHGKVLVEFWASWCHYCEHQVTTLNQFHKDFPNAQIISIQIDNGIARGNFQTATYKAIQSADDNAKTIMRHYGDYALVVPFIVILDNNGSMLDRFAGEANLDDLERLFR